MKICILGANEAHSLEVSYLEALLGLGQEVVILPVRSMFGAYYRASLTNKLKHRIGLSPIYRNLNRYILQEIRKLRPDVVWVFKGMEVFPSTLKAMREAGIALVNFNPDHPFIFSGYGSGNRNVSNGLPAYDLHFCYAKSVMRQIRNEYGVECHRLPFGYSLSHQSYEDLQSEEEILRLCFIGFCDVPRLKVVKYLQDAGVSMDVYGKGWAGKIAQSGTIRLFDPVYGEEYWRTLRRYRIQLNMLRRHNVGNHNMRTFEVPSTGGILLTQQSEEQSEFFEVGEEIFEYMEPDDLLIQIERLLYLPKRVASEVRRKARLRCVNDGYSYAERAKVVVAACRALIA